MYQVAMYYTIKTLLSQGKSIRDIAKDLKMCRKTVARIKTALDNGKDHPEEQVRTKTLDGYKDIINEYFDDGLTFLLIHRRKTYGL
jgi:transposase